ncbi:hypothetical protein DI487_12570 [Flavobacterium sediminis]|uniref:Secretion system C-terminal sorting domain-containing protein n=1 Tax=Flavobacterium sediminis TaxID=2201181 RepID=A0A2U8QXI5_9FLAO|nr:T9SS type B sorting domain-containing protein [Flavobacterium sediminis]AWM14606.1 hypothetical protein DI487_12570 [Flavobacterium sediminis]
MRKNYTKLLLSIILLIVSYTNLFAQDVCSTAVDLGILPSPAPCGSTNSGSTLIYNGTTIGANAENPYSSLSCMDAPAADVWVSFVAQGNQLDINFTSGLNDANIGVYSSPSGNCSDLTGVLCETSNNGNISTILEAITEGETYFMQISGVDETDFADFQLELTAINNCDQCVLASNLTINPTPTGGFYLPGTTVDICFEVTEFEQIGANWLAAIVPSFGPGWDLSTLTGISSPTAGGNYVWVWDNGPEGWGWYVDYDPAGPTGPNGNYTDNYGDPDIDGVGSWIFCFQITTTTSCVPNLDLGINIDTFSDSEMGGWSTGGCSVDPNFPFFAEMQCCNIPLATVTDETCSALGSATVEGQGGVQPYDYVWEDSTGNVIYTDNNNSGISSASGLSAGTYTITVTDDVGCVQIIDVTVSLFCMCQLTNLSGNESQSICQGESIVDILYEFGGVATGVNVSGLPTGVSFSVSGNTLTISGTPTVSGTFNYTVTTIGCTPNLTETGTIDITAPNTPTFTAIGPLCQNSTAPSLPVTSDNGVTGTWSPSSIDTSVAGTSTYTFTPDAGQCSVQTSMDISITNEITPLFTGIGPLCQNSTAPSLPVTSDNGITGIWSPSNIDTSAGGTSTYTFTPDAGQCSVQTSMDITITDEITPLFTGIGPLCQNSTAPSLLVTSDNGVTGTWSPSSIDTSVTGTLTYTFTPDAGQCAVQASMDISITNEITPLFTGIGPLCQNSTAPSLPVTSDNGITGIWSPSNIDTSAGGTSTYTFTPDAGQCAVQASMDITITDEITPVFTAIGPLCQNSTAPSLPVTSDNGITGIWSPSNIDTSAGGTSTYTFTPDAGQCAVQASMDITITDEITPLFTAIGPLCQNSTAPSLPVTSDNGVTGTWSPSSIDTSVAGTSTYTFTPDAGQCAVQASMDITITDEITPVFTAIGPLCQNSTAPSLPVTSDNGVTGTWSPSSIDTSAGGTSTYTFTPDAGQCSVQTSMDISITNEITPLFTGIGPLCQNSTAPSLPVTSDNGITGIWSPSNIDTSAGGTSTYTFTPDAGQCSVQTSMNITITDEITPVFTGIGPLCQNSTAPSLPVTSDNGVTGTWSPSSIDTSVAGTSTYTFTPDAGQCSVQTSMDISITNEITPVFTAIGPLCQNSTAPSLPVTSDNGVTGTWSPSSIDTFVAGTSTYTFTPDAGQCAVQASMNIMINDIHTITQGTDETVCENDAMMSIVMTIGGGATGATVSGLPTGVSLSVSGNTVTISGTPTESGIFTYTVTTTGNGCDTAMTSGTITVNENHTITQGTDETVCENDSMISIVMTIGGGATGAIVSGLPTGVSLSVSGNTATISGTPTESGIFTYTVTTTGNGCDTAMTSGTITVNENHTITQGTDETVCENDAMMSIVMMIGGGATGATVSGLPTGVSLSVSGNTVTISGTPTESGIFTYTVTTTGNGCDTAMTSGTITVNENHTITQGTDETVCENDAMISIVMTIGGGATGATVSGLPTGVSLSVSGNTVTISGTPTESGIFTYTVTTTGNGCDTAMTSGTITVNENHTITQGTDETVCENDAMMSIVMTIGGGATGATVSGLPTGVSLSVSGNTVTISGTPTESGIFTYTVTTTGNGCDTAMTSGTITVNDIHTITQGTDETVCENDAMMSIVMTIGGGATGATVSGLPTGVSLSVSGNTVTISGTPTESGIFTYTVTTTGNGCDTATTSGTITVNEPYTATINYDETSYCESYGIVAVHFNGTGVNGIYTATPSGLSIDPQTGEINTTLSSPATYTVMYEVPQNGACTPYFVTTQIEIKSVPIITASYNTVCNGNQTDIVISSSNVNVSDLTYTWTATIVNVDNSTYNQSGDQSDINQIVNLMDGNTTGYIDMQVVPTANGCIGQPINFMVQVNPIPDPANIDINIASVSVCSGDVVEVNISGLPTGMDFNWVAQTSGLSTTGSTSGTTDSTISLPFTVNDPMQSGTVYFEITPVLGTCVGPVIVSDTITVNPIPGSILEPTVAPEICSEEIVYDDLDIYVGYPNITGVEVYWEVQDAVGVTGALPGNTNVLPAEIPDQLFTTSDSQGYVIYKVWTQLGSCMGEIKYITVYVNPLPEPELENSAICVEQVSGVVYQTTILNAGDFSGGNYQFEWFMDAGSGPVSVATLSNDSTLEVSEAASYYVVVTNLDTNCEGISNTVVVEETNPATNIVTTVTDAFTDSATVVVTVSGGSNGDYLYQLDEESLQSSNVFTGVSSGEHQITVVDTQGCTFLQDTVTVIDYPKYFTPNGDGIHDTWNIVGLNQAEAKLYIFDRYGKLIKQISTLNESQGWDGTYNGHPLPSTDYWFSLQYEEHGVMKEFKAHFSLKR